MKVASKGSRKIETLNFEERVVDAFTAPSFNENQEETLRAMAQKFEEGFKTVVLNAPTGTGKSLINMAFARTMGATIYTTPQISLVNQILKDDLCYPVTVIRGRSNYNCMVAKNNDVIELTDGEERKIERDNVPATKSPSRKYRKFDHKIYGACCEPSKVTEENVEYACPYARDVFKAKKSLANGGNVVTSFDYYLYANMLSGIQKDDGMGNEDGLLDLLIIDEAHNLERKGMSYADVSITENTVPFWESLEKPKTDEREEILNWTEKMGLLTERRIEEIREKEERSNADLEQMDEYQRLLSSLDLVHEMETDYVIEETESPKGFIFKPLYVTSLFRNRVFGPANNVILSSATFSSEMRMLENIGLESSKVAFVDVPHTFPVENRPIVATDSCDLKYDRDIEDIPLHEKDKLASAVKRILEHHTGEKGIVHCGTYELQGYLKRRLTTGAMDDPVIDRIMNHGRGDREEMLEKFREREDDAVMLSVYNMEGLDLKYDSARFNVIAKVPYESMADKRVRARVKREGEFKWYSTNALIKIVQASGRTTRSPKDWSKTYILDTAFTRLYNKNDEIFPVWFKESLAFRSLNEELSEEEE